MVSHLPLSSENCFVPKSLRKPGREPEPIDPKTLGGKIRKTRTALGWSIRELAKRVGVSHVAVVHAETNQHRPDRSTLIRYAQELKSDFGEPDLSRYARALSRDIPVVAYVAGGRPIVEEIEDEFVTIDPSTMKLSGDVVGLKVRGESMVDQHILNGDVLICRRNAEPRKGQITVVDFKGERGATVKRWQRKGEMIYLYADKTAREDEKLAFHDWEVGKVFEVLGLIRDFR